MGIGMEGHLSRKVSSEHRASERKWGKRRVSERGRRLQEGGHFIQGAASWTASCIC
jgi:hypothetical protein